MRLSGTKIAILLRLAEKPASISELAKELGLRPSTIHHHIRELAEAGLIEVVGTEIRRNTVVKLYGVPESAKKRLERVLEESPQAIVESLARSLDEASRGLRVVRVCMARVPASRLSEVVEEFEGIVERVRSLEKECREGECVRIAMLFVARRVEL